MLASASPARLKTLQAAGVNPEVIVSGVDEHCDVASTADRVIEVARRKGQAVCDALGCGPTETVLIAADTMLDIDGVSYGKPHSPQVARQRLHQMSGAHGVLYTGHFVGVCNDGGSVGGRIGELYRQHARRHPGEPLRVDVGKVHVSSLDGGVAQGRISQSMTG